MANERTYLAWIRTSLGAGRRRAGGGGVPATPPRTPSGWSIAIPLLVLGAATALSRFGEWERKERAMRLGESLPVSRVPRLPRARVGVVAIVAAVLTLVDR